MKKTTKSKKQREAFKASQELKEQASVAELLAEKIKKEQEEKIISLKGQILDLCEKEGVWCGLLLQPIDLANIVKLMGETKGNPVDVNFHLYFEEFDTTEEKEDVYYNRREKLGLIPKKEKTKVIQIEQEKKPPGKVIKRGADKT